MPQRFRVDDEHRPLHRRGGFHIRPGTLLLPQLRVRSDHPHKAPYPYIIQPIIPTAVSAAVLFSTNTNRQSVCMYKNYHNRGAHHHESHLL